MEPANKNPEIRKFQSELMGTDVEQSINANKCVSCGGEAVNFDNALSIKEFGISGLCQDCQNDVFQAPEEEDDSDDWEEEPYQLGQEIDNRDDD
jgi:hypothetical protein